MLHRLVSLVDEDEVTVTGCSEAEEAYLKLNHEHFDMVVVDHVAEDAAQVCREAADVNVPVAAIMQEKFADWNVLRKLDVDGYIPDDKGSDEMMARIRAYSRRYAPAQPGLSFSF